VGSRWQVQGECEVDTNCLEAAVWVKTELCAVCGRVRTHVQVRLGASAGAALLSICQMR